MRFFLSVLAVAIAGGIVSHTTLFAQDDTLTVDSTVLQLVDSVEIPAKVSGPLDTIHVKVGQLVESDAILASIEDSDIKILVRESKIELEIARTKLASNVDIEFAQKSKAVAVADLNRAKSSNQKYAGVVSDRELDRLQLLVEQSDADLEKVQFEKALLRLQEKLKSEAVTKSQNELRRHVIRSPYAGQILKIEKQQGEWVNLAEPVFRLVSLER
ncbi:MAG: hypothetical protein AAGA30_20025, partial [Planctomycetota bacterium]